MIKMNNKIKDAILTEFLSVQYEKEKEYLNSYLEKINNNLLKEYRKLFPYPFYFFINVEIFSI